MQISISNAIGGGGGAQGSATPSFSNVNSFLYDGVDEKMFSTANYTELNGSTNFSISFWLKPIDSNDGIVFRFGKQGSTSRLACIYYPSVEIIIISFGTSSYYYRSVNGSIPLNQWSHIVYTYNGALSRYNRPEIYVNGVLSQGTNSGVTSSQSNFDGTLELGGTGTSGQINFGNNYIDEFAVWNSTTLTQTQANELYNSGTPSDLNNIASGLAQPTTWFRMGEEATWNGLTWTMTDVNGGTVLRAANMQESSRTTDVPSASSFTNTKSILLDGVDDYVAVADADNLSFGDSVNDSPFSISVWVNMDDASKFRIITKAGGGTNDNEYALFTSSSDQLFLQLYDSNTSIKRNRYYTTPLTSFEGQWIHIVATYSGVGGSNAQNGIKLYLNGNRVDDASGTLGSYVSMHNTTAPLEIGKLTTTYTNGLIDELSVFNSELSQTDVTNIYNLGIPNDISSLSPLSWWRFEGTGTTATDSGSGGNNGTLTNGVTRSTDVPT